MRPLRALVALALWPAAALADGSAWPPPAREVKVYRGAGESAPSAIPIHRGSAAPGQPSTPARPTPPEPVGGDRLWLVDEAEGALTACREVGTITVGGRRIRCTTRAALSAGLGG